MMIMKKVKAGAQPLLLTLLFKMMIMTIVKADVLPLLRMLSSG